MILKDMILPKKGDSRLIIIWFFVIFVTYALVTPWFGRNIYQFLVVFTTCVSMDLILGKIRTNKWIFPLSGIIASSGMFLVLDAYGIWPYFIVGVLAILSKHLLRVNDRHIFNPNNFGVMLVISAFPSSAMLTAARWGGHILWVLIFMILGLIITIHAKRWILAVSYLSFFAMYVLIKSLLLPVSLTFLMIPLFSPALHLYTYFMITDPRTSPDSPKEQVLFAFCVATVDTYLRYMQNKNAPIIALFIVCLLYNTRKFWRLEKAVYA